MFNTVSYKNQGLFSNEIERLKCEVSCNRFCVGHIVTKWSYRSDNINVANFVWFSDDIFLI